jgi:hypothetical protein
VEGSYCNLKSPNRTNIRKERKIKNFMSFLHIQNIIVYLKKYTKNLSNIDIISHFKKSNNEINIKI